MIGSLFGTGIIIGFAIAAPVGPVGVLCAQRTIARGPLAGLVSGLGAAVADSIFGMFAAFGLSIVAQWIVVHQVWVRGVGGVFLLVLGVRLLLHKHLRSEMKPAQSGNGFGYFASTFILTMTNPITIISFAGIFAAFGVIERVTTLGEGWVLVSGVFVHACATWTLLEGAIYSPTKFGRFLIDFSLSMVVLTIMLAADRWLEEKPRVHRVARKFVPWVIAGAAFVVGVIFVRQTRLLWDDFIFVLFGLAILDPVIHHILTSIKHGIQWLVSRFKTQ